MQRAPLASLAAAVLVTAAGCVPAQIEPDAGFILGPRPDAGEVPVTPDAGFIEAPPDTGVITPPRDGGEPEPDAGEPPEDAGQIADTGPRPDAGVMDAGTVPTTGARYTTPNGIRHIYSQLQAWTTDGVYYLAVDLGTGEGVVYHAGTWEERARLGHIGHRWITGTHQVLMFEDVGRRAVLLAYDLDTGLETEVVALGHPGLRAGRSQEETDRAGRYVAVYIDEATSGGPRIVTADLVMGEVAADVSIAQLGCNFEPDWVGVDPTGQFLLVQSVRDGSGNCSGLWAHDVVTGAAVRQLTDHHNHGSNGVGPTGRPYFLSTELTHPNDNGSPGIYRYWADTGQREVVGAPLPWGALEHVSCLGGPGAPCMVTGSNEFSTQYTGQIWRLDFGGTRTVLEPHRANGCEYWGQSQATLGPDGRYAFTTHGGNCAAIHDIIVQ
jgi:hypothetical protein